MSRPRAGHVPVLIRVAVYLGVIAILFVWRGAPDVRRALRDLSATGAPDTTLAIAGADLAPGLVARIVRDYRRDYPRLAVSVAGGGTAAALEALVGGRADVAFLSRPPTPAEQAVFRTATGDTALCYPVALGGIVLVAAAGAAVTPVALDDLRACLGGGACPWPRLWLPDPNLGLADALGATLGLPPPGATPPAGATYLADEAAVLAAARDAPGSLGAVGWLALPDDPAAAGVRAVPLRAAPGAPPVAPTANTLAAGEYPLHHYLYAACQPAGGIEGTKFVTHLTSDRGQRQIESAGWLPQRRVLREVRLTRRPPDCAGGRKGERRWTDDPGGAARPQPSRSRWRSGPRGCRGTRPRRRAPSPSTRTRCAWAIARWPRGASTRRRSTTSRRSARSIRSRRRSSGSPPSR